MQEIQSTCATLARHHDRMVSQLAVQEAALSTMSGRNKVLQSDNRRLKAQNTEAGKTPPPQQKSNQNNSSGVATENDPAPKLKKRGMGGRKKIEIPPHLPRDKRVIEPENGTICTCGYGMRRIGEQIIERLTYKPAEVRVIEEHFPKYTCRSSREV